MSFFLFCAFLSAAPVAARLGAVQLRTNASQTVAERRLLEMAWHEADVTMLQSPVKDTGYQYFGNAIASDQDLILIGAPGDNVMNFYGSVSIFEARKFELVAYLEPENAQKGDAFGAAVAISGWDALIGAHKTDSHNGGGDMGVVYYYSSSNGNKWSSMQRISAANGNTYDYFGSAVGLYQKNKAVIGAWGSDIAAGGGGAVYTFRMVNNQWSQNARIVSPNPVDFEWFGGSVSVYGHALVVGAAGSTVGGNMGGAAFMYSDATSPIFSLQKKVYGQASDTLGKSVAVHGDLMVVGSPGAYRIKADYYDQFSLRTGRVAVYRWKNEAWTFEEYITCSDCGNGDVFGISVAVNSHSGSVVVGKKKGALVFQYDGDATSGNRWKDVTELKPPGDMVVQDNSYGSSVAISETTAFVGSRDETGLGGIQAGKVFGFVGAVDTYDYAMEKQLRKEIIIYELLYGIIGLGLIILAVLPIVMVVQIMGDKLREEAQESTAKDHRPLIK